MKYHYLSKKEVDQLGEKYIDLMGKFSDRLPEKIKAADPDLAGLIRIIIEFNNLDNMKKNSLLFKLCEDCIDYLEAGEKTGNYNNSILNNRDVDVHFAYIVILYHMINEKGALLPDFLNLAVLRKQYNLMCEVYEEGKK